MPRHFGDLPADTIKTASLVNGVEELRAVIEGHGVGIFSGPPGTGKDFAFAYGLEQFGPPLEEWIVLRYSSAPNERDICTPLWQALEGEAPPERHGWASVIDDLAHKLHDEPRPILVLEAQHLARVGFGTLRQLIDVSFESFPLVLTGSEDFHLKLRRYQCLPRRAMGRQIFEPLTAAEVKSLIPTYHDLYRDAKPAVLAMIDGARCHGRIGFWAAFTYAATIRARGRTTMTQPFAQELLRGDP